MNRLNVWIEGELCGSIEQSPQGDLTFQYSDQYPPDFTPLSLSMPIGHLEFPKSRILPFLKGLLPDNENALQAMAKRFGANARNPFSLLTHIGHEVAGALQLLPEGLRPEHYEDRSTGETQEHLTERQIAELLFSKINEYEDGTAGPATGGLLSLAGAHPKLILRKDQSGNFRIPAQNSPSTHIIKPVPARWQNLDVIEHQTMLAAASLGLNVATTEISSFSGFRVFITERFDREVDSTGNTTRVHQEDLCQALSVDPGKKYQRDEGGPGVAAIAKLVEGLKHRADRDSCSAAFFEGLAFNVLARCTDAHAKNYSLQLKRDRVSFAPLYDLASTVLFSGQSKYSAMSMGGEYRFDDITPKGWHAEIKRLGLDPDWANERLEFFRANLIEAFSQAGSRIRSKTHNAEIGRTTNALTDALAQASR
jgi:serine/threonine-protein kinase HipA